MLNLEEFAEINGEKIYFFVQRKRIKNLNLKVNVDKTVTLSIPMRLSMDVAKDFVRKKSGWIKKQQNFYERVLKEKEGKIIQELYPEIKNSFNQEIQDISFDQPFQLKTTFNKDSSLNLGGFKIDIQDDCLHLNREEVSIQENKVCNDVISPKLQGHYDIELYYDHHVFEIYINGGEYVMSQVVYDLNDQVIIQNTEYKVYVRSL